jgi:hypothetical protein
VTVFADGFVAQAFHGGLRGGSMSARLPGRPDRIERISRGLLALALVAGVIWALGQGASSGPGFFPGFH